MDSYTKHTLFAMAVGFWISTVLILDFWPSVVLGLILAALARILSELEDRGRL
jgi:fatty acid desaturase